MDDVRPPPKFIRLRPGTGPEEVCRADLVPDDPSSDRNSPPAHDADPIPDDPSSSTTQDASNSENSSSCRHAELEKIKDQLISRNPSDLKVVPIVGMGGIGKTTLAKTLYEDAVVSRQFHLRSWIAISQDYNLENVLLSLLRSVDPDRADKVTKQKNPDLEQALYQSLKGRRYLIVLDDIWSDKTWNDFNSIFPNDDNGSRILLTTRLVEVARYVEPNHPPHCLDCLSHEESWRLLQSQVFHGKACPSDLEEIGKAIAKKCHGLPLAIVVVAGHLSNIDEKQDSWADVAKMIDSLMTRNKVNILDILSLSYNHLPQHLKASFLYMGIFPKNFEIHIKNLIRMLTAAGLLQSEDEAEQCLKNLINRNLIMVKEKKYGRDTACGVHDLLWDLIIREAQNEGLYVFNRFNRRHARSSKSDVKHLLMYLTSSYLYPPDSFGNKIPCESVCLSLLTVLNIQHHTFADFPESLTNLFALRYLEIRSSRISGSVSKLFYLETLINWYTGRYELPREIWSLGCLKHLQAIGAVYLKMIPSYNNNILETLSTISLRSCEYIDLSRIPNLKQLKFFEFDRTKERTIINCLKGLVNSHQLEKLKLKFAMVDFGLEFSKHLTREKQIPWCDMLPLSLKQLTLRGSYLPWKAMNILAELPNIEVLKLMTDACVGQVYGQTVEGFPKLKLLVFDDLKLRWWIAEAVHYPVLQHLVLRHCSRLEQIPRFEELETLKSIELVSCRPSVLRSARSIQQEQHSNGNYDLQLSISFEFVFPRWDDEMHPEDLIYSETEVD